jgi:SAM-dependent methyltransferase
MTMQSTDITDHDRFYWQYEYDVVARYLLPLIETWGVKLKGGTLLDVGCGDGGGLSAFYDAGMHCTGFDIEERRVELANLLAGKRTFHLTTGDIYIDDYPFKGQTFDLVVLHDVFEHLEHKAAVLEKLAAYANPDGFVFITFPPYFSAFGAHQQFLHSKFGKMPFFHLMPFALSTVMPKLKNQTPGFVQEIQKLASLKMGIGKFESLVNSSSLRIAHKKFYAIGPNHIRFGLKPLDAGVLGKIPGIRELAVAGVLYLLKK